jgi:hypothetical protein
MSAVPDARPAGSAEAAPAIGAIRLLWRRTATLSLLELAKLRHDRTELYTRAVQPALWLLVFGETFSRIHAIPTSGRLPYLDYLAPGIMAQSALFIAIFYGIQLIWERDFGILTKLLATPTPRAALVAGKAFAAGVRAVSQVLVVLFFASNALDPTEIMPAWVRAVTHINALRRLLLGLPGSLAADFAALLVAAAVGIAARLPAARAARPLSAPNGAGLQAGPVLIAPARAGSPAGVAGCRSTAR